MLFENPRMWIFYYLICFVALLWVGFLSVQGVMIFVSLLITMIVFGFSILLCVMLVMELREKGKQEELTTQDREIS
jgi:phosphotransferase system  glucose/maltose/N-acetylglucosamine-specific IIC component